MVYSIHWNLSQLSYFTSTKKLVFNDYNGPVMINRIYILSLLIPLRKRNH